VGRRDLVEGITAIDHRAKGPVREPGQELDPYPPADRDLLLERAGAQRRPRDGRTLGQEHPDVDVRGPSAHESDLDDPASDHDGPDVPVHVVAADHVEHHVDPRAVGESLDRGHEVLGPVVDGEICAEGTAGGQLPGRRGDGDPGADRLRDLDGGGADPGGAGVDECGPSRRQPSLRHEGVVGRDEDLRDRGGVLDRHGVGDRQDHPLVGDEPVGVCPAADDAHHRLPDAHLLHS
jgi:hypothetical protein